MPEADTNYGQLQELEWMIGDWVDKEGDMAVETTCDWTKNGNYMLRTYRAINGDVVEMEGTQIVGWDAARGQIRSWVFDTDGGFGEGYWSRNGNTWTIEATFQDATGGQGTSTNSFTWVDSDTFTYQSANRVLNGEQLPDVGPFTIKRSENTDTDTGAEQ